MGLPNVGVFHSVHFETWNVGVLGPVTLSGLSEGERDLSKQEWYYQISLKGEVSTIYTEKGSASVNWVEGAELANKRPLTWYKQTSFDEPAGIDPLALDMLSMGKGQIWINGQSIGRHWPTNKTKGNCVDKCNMLELILIQNVGYIVDRPHRWFHAPRGWLKPTRNLLVVFEEMGGVTGYIALTKETR